MATLNQTAERIAYALGNPLDVMLKQNIKFSISNYRALFIRRDIAANGMSDGYLQKFHTTLIKVDKVDDCNFTVDCTILRTTNKVPSPVRLKSDVLFKFVGDAMGKPFTYTEFEELDYRLHNKFTSKEPFYSYINGYIYVFNATKLKRLGIQHIFEYPEQVNLCQTDCYNDDMEYPMPADLLASVVSSILTGEFKILQVDNSEVPVNTEKS